MFGGYQINWTCHGDRSGACMQVVHHCEQCGVRVRCVCHGGRVLFVDPSARAAQLHWQRMADISCGLCKLLCTIDHQLSIDLFNC